MALSLIGAAAAEATSITIPGTYQNGDIMIIFAFRDGDTTIPSLPAGWTGINTVGFGTLCASRLGYKVAGSASETSGTWTNTTGLVCHVYRGQATNKTPVNLGTVSGASGSSTFINYSAIFPVTPYASSWLLGFAGHRSIDVSIGTAPTNMTNQAALNGATASYGGHDTNGTYTGNWPSTSPNVGGTSSGWNGVVVELFAEQLGNLENYKFAKDGGSNSGKLSFGERIR